VAENGQAHLSVSNTIFGQPVENNHVWITSGIGFVPDETVQPCFLYEAVAFSPIYQDHRPDAPIAEGGRAQLRRGATILGIAAVPDWVWISSGIGFVPQSALQVRDARMYVVQPGDTLGGIAQQFYGSPENWRAIYLANRSAIGADPNLIFDGQRLLIP
jgi:hypothetical protein